jgi:hypothetical protein
MRLRAQHYAAEQLVGNPNAKRMEQMFEAAIVATVRNLQRLWASDAPWTDL